MHNLRNKLKKINELPIFREFKLYTFSNVFQQVASFVSILFVSRYLGPNNLGLYSFVQNYGILYITIIAGSDYYYMWSLARSEDKAATLRDYLVAKLYLSVLLTTLAVSIAYLTLPHDVFVLIGIFMAPLFLHSLLAFHLYALHEKRAKLVSFIQSITVTCSILLKLLLVYIQAPLAYFVATAAVDVFMSGIFFFLYFVYIDDKNSFFDFKSFKFIQSIQKSAIFFWNIKLSIVAVFLWQLLLRADQLILGALAQFNTLLHVLLGKYESSLLVEKVLNKYQSFVDVNNSATYMMGIYSAAIKIAEVPNVLAGVIYLVLISRMTKMVDADNEQSKSKLKKIFYLYIALGLVMAIFIILVAPLATHIIYGEKFIGVADVLRVYALSIPAMYALYYYFSVFGAEGRHRLQVIVFLSSLFINILLVLTLTPLYGLMGTASATVVAYTLAAIIFYKYSNR